MFRWVNKSRKNEKGFTLVELMVVVVIIGILVAIAIPVYNNATNTANRRAVEANLRTLDGAIQQHIATVGTPPAALADLQTGGYIASVPTGPAGVTSYGLTATAPIRATVTIPANTFGTHAAQTNATLPITW